MSFSVAIWPYIAKLRLNQANRKTMVLVFGELVLFEWTEGVNRG
jgi:hypothetical protein